MNRYVRLLIYMICGLILIILGYSGIVFRSWKFDIPIIGGILINLMAIFFSTKEEIHTNLTKKFPKSYLTYLLYLENVVLIIYNLITKNEIFLYFVMVLNGCWLFIFSVMYILQLRSIKK